MKVLVVGDPNSIHTSRFITVLQELGHQIHVFQSENYYWQEEQLQDVDVYVSHPGEPPKNGNRIWVTWPVPFKIRSAGRFAELLAKGIKYLNAKRSRGAELARLLRRLSPDVVFSLKMQNDGYTLAQARARLGKEFPCPWVHFVWGTDIEFFGKSPAYAPDHLPRIRAVLENCDYLITDSHRDARQVADFGFRGHFLGVAPAFAGFDLEALDRVRKEAPDRRDVILIKGRQGGYVGKAMNVLRAIETMPERFRGYRVVLVAMTVEVYKHAIAVAPTRGIVYEAPNMMPYRDLLALFARARLTISATDVDGMPAFLVESMAMGALPIHSDMESVREWVVDGENALLFPVDDEDAIRQAIIRGLEDDALCERAAQINAAVVRQRLDRNDIRETMRGWLQLIKDGSSRR